MRSHIFAATALVALGPSALAQEEFTLPRELEAGTAICWNGQMEPAQMRALAAERGYEPLSETEIQTVSPESAQGLNVAAWADGDGRDRVRVVTYEALIANIPHVVCVIDAVSPTPEETFGVLYEFLGAPRRDDWRAGERHFTWYWEQDGRYVVADYVASDDGQDAKLTAKARVITQ